MPEVSTGSTSSGTTTRRRELLDIAAKLFAERGFKNTTVRDLWTGLLRDGVAAGELRADLDVELVYRFLRDTVWVAVRWYRPGGDMTPAQVADQYLHILLDG